MSWLSDLIKRLFKPKPPNPPDPPPIPPTDITGQLIVLHNKKRVTIGLAPLTLNPMLTIAAQKHTTWMADHGQLTHSGDGQFGDRITAAGYVWRSAGENIAEGYATPQAVVAGWMDSQGHRANILGSYKDVGFGIAKDFNGRLYWTADFGNKDGSRGMTPPRLSGPLIEGE